MKYFILEQGKEYDRNPQIKGWYGKLDRHYLARMGENLKDKMIFDVSVTDNTIFPDIMKNPILMISAKMKDIIYMYEKHIFFKEIFLNNLDNNYGYVYYIPYLPPVNCFTNKSRFSKDKSYVEIGVVDSKKLWNRHIVEAEGINGQCVVISLDLAESMLRNGLIGIGLREIEMS